MRNDRYIHWVGVRTNIDFLGSIRDEGHARRRSFFTSWRLFVDGKTWSMAGRGFVDYWRRQRSLRRSWALISIFHLASLEIEISDAAS